MAFGRAGLLLLTGIVLAGCQRIDERRFAFALVGDNPYSAETYPRYERLIEDVNRQADLTWVLHVGDMKAGNQSCSDEEMAARFALNERFTAPFVLTPGDNDWLDCDGPRAGGYDPSERLAALRRLFYPTPGRVVGSAMQVESQSTREEFGEFVENAMWTRGGVVFATIHALAITPDEQQSHRRLSEAGSSWLQAAFQRARESNAPGLFLAMQADPWYITGLPLALRRFCPECPFPRPGLEWLYPALVEGAQAFGRPVVLAVGDTHVFRIDKPLYTADGRLVENFTRVETFGNPDVHWVRVTVDPKTASVFSFDQQLVQQVRRAEATGAGW